MTNKKPLPAIGRIIKKKLIEKNMTQSELAEALDMNEKYLSQIVRGCRGQNSSKYYEKIYKILEISESEIPAELKSVS